MAPDTVWASMSPMFDIARPSASSAVFSSLIVVPDRTVTRPEARSALTMPFQPDRSSAAPEVTAAGVNECPLPRARTVSPSRAAAVTASTISSVLRGQYRLAGLALAVPAQFCQV